MIRELIQNRVSRPVHLFWGGEREADIYDRTLVETWAKSLPWFSFTPVLASPDAGWAGATGFVQDAVLARYPNLSAHEVYACGNPVMITHASKLLTERGALAADRFHSDAFVFSGQAES
jgi:CDP-4-dehydro-6-deoxyglucose reductase/3-phenylpropionate/trans-cinnamate dioxygenase ferredoxin reductase subunit